MNEYIYKKYVKQSIQEFLKELKKEIANNGNSPMEEDSWVELTYGDLTKTIDTLAKQKFGDALL